MGDLYPNANILGVDLSPIQPEWVPPNVKFMVDDVESPWLSPRNHFDYIHGRHTVMAIRDWPKLMRRVLEYVFSPFSSNIKVYKMIKQTSQARRPFRTPRNPPHPAIPRQLSSPFSPHLRILVPYCLWSRRIRRKFQLHATSRKPYDRSRVCERHNKHISCADRNMAEKQAAENGGSLLEGDFADWGRTDCVGAIDEGIGMVKGAG